jgi:hypothetical protein
LTHGGGKFLPPLFFDKGEKTQMEIRKLFRRNEISMNRIHHTVIIKEQGERLKLIISADPMRLVAGLTKAQAKLTEVVNAENPTDAEITDAAIVFASTILGKEQAEKLLEFYAGDAACVINVCGQIFRDQLTDKIAKAQKKMG